MFGFVRRLINDRTMVFLNGLLMRQGSDYAWNNQIPRFEFVLDNKDAVSIKRPFCRLEHYDVDGFLKLYGEGDVHLFLGEKDEDCA